MCGRGQNMIAYRHHVICPTIIVILQFGLKSFVLQHELQRVFPTERGNHRLSFLHFIWKSKNKWLAGNIMFCPNCRTRDVEDKWLVGQISVGQVDKAPGLCTGGDNKMLVYVQEEIKKC